MKVEIRSSITLFMWALLLSPAGLQAAVPPTMTIQGQLGGINEGAFTTNTAASQVMTFRVYSATNAPAALFGRTNVTVMLEQGRFVAELGDGAALSTKALSGATYASFIDMLADATNKTFYLGLHPAGLATNLFPLMRIQSVPFALVAGDVKQATKTFEVRNGTATLRTMLVQGETTLKGDVRFEGASPSIFSEPVTIGGNVTVKGGKSSLANLNVADRISVTSATFNGLRGLSALVQYNNYGSFEVAAGMTTVSNIVSMSAGMTVTGSLAVAGTLYVNSFQATDVKITDAFTLPSNSKLKNVFGSRACVSNVVTTVPANDTGWSNSFYEVTSAGDTGTSVGYWKAPQDCFVTVSYVVGCDADSERGIKYIAMTGTTPYITASQLAPYCIAMPYARSDGNGTFGAHKGCVCSFMRKGTYLCWYSPDTNRRTVFGAGFMREISVLYFSK